MRVVSAQAEGRRVYALLEDDQVLVRELEDERTAAVFAPQVVGLTAAFLIRFLRFQVAEDV